MSFSLPLNVFSHLTMTVLGLCLSLTLTSTANAQTRLKASEVVPEFVAMGLNPEVYKQVDRRQLELYEEEDKYYLEIRFGKLTSDQFDSLKAYFGGFSQVTYSPEREYDLLDFLPPAIQAVANQVFEPVYLSSNGRAGRMGEKLGLRENHILFSADKNGMSNFTNCWNTTIEILQNIRSLKAGTSSEYMVYWPGRWETNDLLSEDKYSDLIDEREVRTGDVIIFKQRNTEIDFTMIQHTAFVLTSELVFEKTDTSENDAYRISLRRDVQKKFEKFFEKELIVEHRRFGGPGKRRIDGPKLPSKLMSKKERQVLAKLFPKVNLDCVVGGCETGLGGGCDYQLSEVHVTKITTNPATGRGILSGDQAVLKRFKPLVPMKSSAR